MSIIVNNCSGERTFFKMGIIKSVLRSTMGWQRLNMLSLMIIERDVLRAIDFDDKRLRCRRSLKLIVLQPSTYDDRECKLYNSSFQRQMN